MRLITKPFAAALVAVALVAAFAPAASASGPTPEDCDYTVTAAGNGYQGHVGTSLSGPVYGAPLYTGEVLDILARSTGSGDGFGWLADESDYNANGGYANNFWYPSYNQTTGVYLMTKILGSCEVLGHL